MLMHDIQSLSFEPLRAVYPALANMSGCAQRCSAFSQAVLKNRGLRL